MTSDNPDPTSVNRRKLLIGAGAVAGTAGWAASGRASSLAMPGGEPELRMVYQVNRDDADYYGHILFSLGEVLRQTDNRAGLTAVCFGPGLNLLTARKPETVSQQARDRVKSLMTYGVAFHACRQTMEAMEIGASGLMEGVEVVPAGVLDMARLQKEGYAYVAW